MQVFFSAKPSASDKYLVQRDPATISKFSDGMTFTAMEEEIADKERAWKTKEEFETEWQEWSDYNKRNRSKNLDKFQKKFSSQNVTSEKV